jgi:hypothetical protein
MSLNEVSRAFFSGQLEVLSSLGMVFLKMAFPWRKLEDALHYNISRWDSSF